MKLVQDVAWVMVQGLASEVVTAWSGSVGEVDSSGTGYAWSGSVGVVYSVVDSSGTGYAWSVSVGVVYSAVDSSGAGYY